MKKSTTLGILVLSLIVFATVVGQGEALAGSPTATFLDDLSTELTDWMSGTLGKFFAIATLIISVAIAAFRHDFLLLFAGIGVAAAAFFGPAAINSIFTAILG